MKELIFVHDWVGPEGPAHNGKTLDVFDLAKRGRYTTCDYRHSSTSEIDPLVMELARHTKCRVVPSYELDSIRDKVFFYELQLSQKMGFSAINLSGGIGFLDHAPVSQPVLDAVRNRNGYILVTCILESFLEDHVFHQFYSYFESHNIPLNKVIYLSNCANAKELHFNWCRRNGVVPILRCEYIGLYLLNQTGILKDPRFEKRSPNFNNHDKVFLNLNRRMRPHRFLLLLKMVELGILDKFKMSFNREFNSVKLWTEEVQRYTSHYGINLREEQIHEIYHRLPFVLDTDNFSNFPMEADLFSTAPLYDTTLINVVSETNFENNIIHMTEKTIKPIVFKQPFIIVGPAHTLKYLHQMGFKTFSQFWNEDYDNILDPVERMNAIFKVIEQIHSWDRETLEKVYIECQDIVQYNFNVFKEQKAVELNNFVRKYGSEK